VINRRHPERERLLALVFLGLEIENCCLVVDLAQPGHCPCGVEQVLG